MHVLKNKKPVSSGVIVAAGPDTASTEKPGRTQVREDFKHCPGPKWQVKQPGGMSSKSNEPVSSLAQ